MLLASVAVAAGVYDELPWLQLTGHGDHLPEEIYNEAYHGADDRLNRNDRSLLPVYFSSHLESLCVILTKLPLLQIYRCHKKSAFNSSQVL